MKWLARQSCLTQFLLFPLIASLALLLLIPACILLAPDTPLFFDDLRVLTNDYRLANGLHPLTYNALLESAAYAHASDPASTGSHTGSDGSTPKSRVIASGYIPLTVAENIFISSYEPDPEHAMDGWKNSPGHDKNLRNPSIREIGTAKHYHDDQHRWVVVAVYGA